MFLPICTEKLSASLRKVRDSFTETVFCYKSSSITVFYCSSEESSTFLLNKYCKSNVIQIKAKTTSVPSLSKASEQQSEETEWVKQPCALHRQ